jgi:hypothetical protein
VLFGDERPARSPMYFPIFRKKSTAVRKKLEEENDIRPADKNEGTRS